MTRQEGAQMKIEERRLGIEHRFLASHFSPCSNIPQLQSSKARHLVLCDSLASGISYTMVYNHMIPYKASFFRTAKENLAVLLTQVTLLSEQCK